MIRTSQKQLIDSLRSLKITSGHVILIHSSMIRFGEFEGGMGGMMDCLHQVLGQDATILMPSFTLAFASSRTWDYKTSKAETGVLTEYFRNLPDTRRTTHPFHSLSVSGPRSHEFLACKNHSSFGEGSPFELLYDMEAINLSLGIGLVGGATFLHHAEEVAGVPYRIYKNFPGDVFGEDGIRLPNTYKMFVRRINANYEYQNKWNHTLFFSCNTYLIFPLFEFLDLKVIVELPQFDYLFYNQFL